MCSSLFSALLIELETLRSNAQRDDDDVRDQNLLYSFSRRERLKPPSRSLFFFLSDFVRRLLLYTRGLFYAESFSFTTLMRFLFSCVCSENCRRDSAPTKTLNKKGSSSSLRLERNLSYRSFFLIFLKHTLLVIRERLVERCSTRFTRRSWCVLSYEKKGREERVLFFAFFLLG